MASGAATQVDCRTMSNTLPAVSLAAVPKRRNQTLDLAREIERRGYAGIYCPSLGDALGLCQSIAHVTERIPFGTSIVNVYTRHAIDYAQTAAYIHEVSGGRFRFGVGVSHGPMLKGLGIEAGRPLQDMRAFVETWKAAPRVGELPPLVLAGLRSKMVAMAGELADGVVFANVARSHVPESLGGLPGPRDDFFVGDNSVNLASNIAVRSDIITTPELISHTELSATAAILGDQAITDGGITVAQRLAEVFETTISFAATGELGATNVKMSEYASQILAFNATQAAEAENQIAFKEVLYSDIKFRAESFSGVNIDEEMANLITLQNSFSAVARVITVTQEMMDTLNNIA